MTSFIFDIDGTLTPSRQLIDYSFKRWFSIFCKRNKVYLVTGSDYPKVVEQLGIDICNSVQAVYSCSGNECFRQGKLIYANSWQPCNKLLGLLEKELFNSTFIIRTGKHIENRPGCINFSIVGRNANKEDRLAYIQWDRQNSERTTIVSKIENSFVDLEAVIGGETGIDIYPLGKNKSQILQYINDKVYFFGDGIFPGGNDYSISEYIIANKLGAAIAVKSWVDTYEKLYYLVEQGKAA